MIAVAKTCVFSELTHRGASRLKMHSRRKSDCNKLAIILINIMVGKVDNKCVNHSERILKRFQ